MKNIKLLALFVALLGCSTVSAQFTNTNPNANNNRSQQTSNENSSSGAVMGYSGFIELGYVKGIGTYDFDRFELTTSQGFQINSHIFVGLGTGIKYFYDESAYGIPFYTDFRINFLKKKVSPFAGFKLGYTTGDVSGLMLTPMFGCRFGFYKNFGLILSLGYDYQSGEVVTTYRYYSYYSGTYYYNTSKHRENLGGIFLKIGLEF